MELTLLANALTAAAFVWGANRLFRPAVDRSTDLLIGAAAVGLLVGRLAAMIGAGVNPLVRPGDILVVRGGVSTGFAALGALVALGWTLRHDLPRSLDLLAPAALAGLAGWHGGCLWRNTCLGTAAELPWAMTAAGSDTGRHPVEVYAALALIAGAIVVRRLRARPWLATGSALAIAGAVQLVTDPMRVSIVGGPTGWYFAAVVIGTGLAVFSQRLTRTRPPGPSSMTISPP